MYLSSCTLTGVDEETPLAELERLSKLFPQAEWGLLYSPKRQGTTGRYPSIAFLEHCFEQLSETVRIALHVCGDGVENLLRGNSTELHLLQHVAKRNGRIQLNFNQKHDPVDLDILAVLLHGHPETTFITQHNDANGELIEELLCRGVVNHAVLFDSSGGQGVECMDWPKPVLIPCGYAGGLGPDNIATEFCKIAAKVGERTIWIDMEDKLRRKDRDGVDWLDLCRCRTVLDSACCRPLRSISEREIALALVKTMADFFVESGCHRLAPNGLYDQDADLLACVASKVNTFDNKALRSKIFRVARKLAGVGVLTGKMVGTQKAYFGEPSKQMVYSLCPGDARLIALAGDGNPRIGLMGSDGEAAFLIRRAYPA